MDETKQIIEINGVKFEVDARTATLRKVDTIRIGARVKVLQEKYGDNFEVKHGVVVGFEPFKTHPTVIVAYIDGLNSYGSGVPEIKFLYYTAKSKEQIIISDEDDMAALDAGNVIAQIERSIEQKRQEIQNLEDRKGYFKKNFRAYWGSLELAE